MNKIKIYIIALVVLIGSVIFGVSVSDNLGGSPISPNLNLGSNLTVTATTTAKLILAEASNAQLRTISNVGSYDIWISATTTNLAANYGLWIKASSSQIFAGDNLYTGAIYGIGTGTTTIAIFQY